jgi:lactococcin 972 family bacteriocin
MKLLKRIGLGVTVAGVAAGFALAGVTAANAATAYPPEGGTWDYGVISNNVFSNYHHPTRNHRRTACNGENHWSKFNGWASPGIWHFAAVWATPAGNKAYYDVQ